MTGEKFYIARNADSDEMFGQALKMAGYMEVADPAQADFILHDAVHPGLEKYIRTKPSFIFPHTPQSSFLWDGILGIDPVCCNFVYGEAGKKAMNSYGYPHRVEAVGFSRCNVRDFKPSKGNDLLIIPSHPLQHGEYTYENYIEWAIYFLRFILKNRYAFGKITLCWNETRVSPVLFEELKRHGVVVIPTNPYVDPEPLKRMIERMERADLVAACGTAGCVSVALGRPTVFFSERGQPRSRPRDALHPELYLNYLRFPLQAENMTLEEILAVRTAKISEVEYWKQQNIGGPFNADKFVSVVREYLK